MDVRGKKNKTKTTNAKNKSIQIFWWIQLSQGEHINLDIAHKIEAFNRYFHMSYYKLIPEENFKWS